jgi:hypothetical protein
MNIDSNYIRIAAVVGTREKLPLGKYALRKALVILSQAGNQNLKHSYFARSCLTIMQMIPESARYRPFLEFIYNNYYRGRAPGLELIRKQKLLIIL